LGLLSDISGDQTQRKQFSSASKIIFKEELIFEKFELSTLSANKNELLTI
jgi:hypothetical protein